MIATCKSLLAVDDLVGRVKAELAAEGRLQNTAGCTLGPYPTGQTKPDGISFLALMDGTVSTLRRDAVLDELPEKVNGIPVWNAVSTTTFSSLGLWHYVEYPATGEKELYDVSRGPCWLWTGGSGDPCELQNRIGDSSLAQVRAALAARLAELKK
jgi:hypothetical protein